MQTLKKMAPVSTGEPQFMWNIQSWFFANIYYDLTPKMKQVEHKYLFIFPYLPIEFPAGYTSHKRIDTNIITMSIE